MAGEKRDWDKQRIGRCGNPRPEAREHIVEEEKNKEKM